MTNNIRNSATSDKNNDPATNISCDISVLVATYHPSMEKLLVTLRSALMQRGVSIQIVIADDGSGDDLDTAAVTAFFEKNGFTDYKIAALTKNKGTVENLINGLNYCHGEYVKPISPGDYLYGETILRDWMNGMKKHGCIVGFADDICYSYTSSDISPENLQIVSVQTHPQKNHGFYRNSWGYNYLIFEDLVRGATTLVNTQSMKKYLGMLQNKVVYAEDNIYRLMAGAGERAFFLGKGAVLYELGTGISTAQNDEWMKKIAADWASADEILLADGFISDETLRKSFIRLSEIKKSSSSIKRTIGCLRIPGKLRSITDHRLHTRYTAATVDEEYVRLIHET
ncbi:MAG: glycosyltransferase [Eubacterium sp.]|nr:glycosyltransferase [Eubacterium sp.]